MPDGLADILEGIHPKETEEFLSMSLYSQRISYKDEKLLIIMKELKQPKLVSLRYISKMNGMNPIKNEL